MISPTPIQAEHGFIVRQGRPKDSAAIAELFHLVVNASTEHYSQAQCQAWSPAQRSEDEWRNRLQGTALWVAEDGRNLLGFINLKPLNAPGEAEIDCLFTHPNAQRRGIAAELYRQLLRYAVDSGVQCLRVEASFYAKAFFGKQGFTTLKRNQHQRHGEVLTNFSMQLQL
ncbi:GNAT family N-acetyltransferase [Shewanella algae]|nr:GNAT family N-acetyltransferase [Shewanella algae]